MEEGIAEHYSSESQLKYEDSYFLNVGKMNLLENNGQKVLYSKGK